MRPPGTRSDRTASLALTRPPKLADQTYDRIFGLIVDGEFPEGTRLPTEAELSHRFGVSRTIVREALARLRDDGIVISRQGAGTFVLRRPDAAVLDFSRVGSIADIQRCYDFRIALEGEAAALAATEAVPQTMRRIEEAVEALDEIVRTGRLGTDADYHFHMAVAEATRNRFFVSVMASLHDHIAFAINLARSLSLKRTAARISAVQAEHRAIFDAIRARDPQLARTAMRQHLSSARNRIFEGAGAAESDGSNSPTSPRFVYLSDDDML